MTKTYRDNCNINIVQQTSCALLFADVQTVKNVLFHSFCTSMYTSQLWGEFRKAYIQRLCVVYSFGSRALYNLPWRASISIIRFKVTFLPLRPYWEKMCTCFLNGEKSLTTYGCMLHCSQIVYVRPYSLGTTTTFYFVNKSLDITVLV